MPLRFTEADAATHDVLGTTIRVRVPSAGCGGHIAVCEETTPPGWGPPLHIHHKQTETFHILEGAYRFRVRDDVVEAGPGDMLVVPPGAPHAFKNIGDTPGRFVFSMSPGLKTEEFFETLANLPPPGTLSFEEINARIAQFDAEMVGPPLD